jgi:uncharacterized protein (DUF1501 family)
MAITRREFLKRAGLATAGTVVAPGLFGGNPWVRNAFADTIGDRYFVVLFLDGGNDGQNTVIPLDDSAGLLTAYNNNRSTGIGGLRIVPGDTSQPSVIPMVDPNGTALGLHPGLASLTSMYDAGNVAIVQGTGYPAYSLSHAESTTIWETANPTGNATIAGTGWAGRHLALEYGPSDIYAVTIRDAVAGEFRTAGTSVLALQSLADFGFPIDPFDPGDQAIYEESFQDVYAHAQASSEPLTTYLGNSGQATYDSTQSYPPLHATYVADRGAFNNAYGALGTSVSRNLREVAKMIYGTSNATPGISSRFFQLRNGGYDTHADQGGADPDGQHYALHSEVADAVDLFFQDMSDMGVGNKVTMVIWSEFGRRIPQNSNGTDHGSQGPMFVIGEPVNGGIYGNHPNIAALDPQENTVYSQSALDPFRSTDFRDVFGTLLKHWVNMPELQILSDVLPLDTVGSPNEYWQTQEFDMGFL